MKNLYLSMDAYYSDKYDVRDVFFSAVNWKTAKKYDTQQFFATFFMAGAMKQ